MAQLRLIDRAAIAASPHQAEMVPELVREINWLRSRVHDLETERDAERAQTRTLLIDLTDLGCISTDTLYGAILPMLPTTRN